MSRFQRQSFLGENSEQVLRDSTLGFVGLGGGGSHLVQQCAHLGIGGYVLVDPDHLTDTNTNRLIGCMLKDVKRAMLKVKIARRMIRGLVESPRLVLKPTSWHEANNALKQCDVIVGAVDSYVAREQLERFSRRHLIPYVDIGMDVHRLREDHHLISGQVILSLPGEPCLRCCGLITEERLAQEVAAYGAAGGKPQVVWPNGVLASTAIGLVMQLLTPWLRDPSSFVYLDYDGNRGTLTPNPRMMLLKERGCPHHPVYETGDPLFDVRSFQQQRRRSPASRDHILGFLPHRNVP